MPANPCPNAMENGGDGAHAAWLCPKTCIICAGTVEGDTAMCPRCTGEQSAREDHTPTENEEPQ